MPRTPAGPDPRPLRPARIATYRWQLTAGDGFDAAAAAAPDLAELGVSHLYLSPVAEAVPGSTHGYDAVDPGHLRAELGGAEGFARLVATCRDAGLGLVVDIVPNHLAAHEANPWWWDVLRRGRRSEWAGAFDIDWTPPKRALQDTVLLPILGDHYGRELEAGNLRLERGAGTDPVVLRYQDHRLPLSPETAAELAGEDLDRVNADADRLDVLLDRQAYRLARWTVGDAEGDYRRFFDIDTLVATRADRPEVFDALHRLPGRLVAEGVVDGLRVDHVDGLRDPEGYLHRLREATGPGTWLLVEKILRPGEDLPSTWPVQGTTGYEVADLLGGWLTDPDGAEQITTGWKDRVGETRSYAEVALAGRREVLSTGLVADVERVVDGVVRVCEGRRRHRDHTRRSIQQAVVELAAHAPAYRSYVRFDDDDRPHATTEDVGFVTAAVDGARRDADLDDELLDLLRDLFLGRLDGEVEHDVALRFQQLTGPVAAKGEEDTALYRWLPLPHRCEVGADPGRPSWRVEDWHTAAEEAHRRWPQRLTTLSTHDTKRSADVRARLAALTTIPMELLVAFDRWREAIGLEPAGPVDAGSAWLAFHALVGAHPVPIERAWPVVEKSVREAGLRTSWTDPDPDFEAALHRAVEVALVEREPREVVERLLDRLGDAGEVAALGQLAAQLLAPGVPDVYQGGETWERALVDPDNRRPVDADQRRRLLRQAREVDAATSWSDPTCRAAGLPRLKLVQAALGLRRRHAAAFGPGDAGAYRPVEVAGADEARVLAYERGDRALVVAVRPGPGAQLAADAEVALPGDGWRDVLTGTTHGTGPTPVDRLTQGFPVAVLERDPAG